MIRWLALFTLAAQPALADMVVPTRTIRPQDVVTAQDVKLVPGDPAGGFAVLEEVIGQEARVALYPGQQIALDEIGPPAVIDRNQIVTLRYAHGSLTIATEGRALGRAGVGDRLRVMNLMSRRAVFGIVQDDGTVRVSGQ